MDQMNFVQRCYVMELRRRVKHHQSNHLRLIRDNKMSKSSPTLSGSLKSNKSQKKKRRRRDSEFYKPGTEVRVIRKGKYMFQTGTVVHRHYDEEETKKKKKTITPVPPPRPGDGGKRGPPPPPRKCSFTLCHSYNSYHAHNYRSK